MKIWESAVVTLEYDENNKIILQIWKGFANSSQFREVITKTVELFKQKNASTLLVDAVKSSVVKKEDADFASDAIKSLNKSIKAQAFVMPANAFVQISVKNYKDNTQDAVKTQYFDSVDKAKEWLKNQ